MKVSEKKMRKTESYEKLHSLIKSNNVIVIADMFKVRASLLMRLRKQLRGTVTFFSAKKSLVGKALASLGFEKADEFLSIADKQFLLAFANGNIFDVVRIIEDVNMMLFAKAGDTATEDVVVPAGNTGIPPGPIISEFKEAKIPIRIDTGSVWVAKDTVVLRAGEQVSPKLSSLLKKLNVKAVKANLKIGGAYSDGILLKGDALHLDLLAYRRELEESVLNAVKLSLGIDYYVPDTLPVILGRAFLGAKNLALSVGYYSSETIHDFIQKAQTEAVVLSSFIEGRTRASP